MLEDFNRSLNPCDTYTNSSRVTRGMTEFWKCLLYFGLFDLSYRENHFTWWNSQEENVIAKKLDCILINDIWLRLFPLSYGLFGDMEFSDHCPSCVHFGNMQSPKNRPFRCPNFITLHPDFLAAVK